MTGIAGRPDVVRGIAAGRRRRARRRVAVTAALAAALAMVFAAALMVGDTFYSPGDVVRVVLGETVPGASFTVGELRLPRAAMGALAGLAFGMAGVTFQSMLRNPLAAPDVIGISSGASAAAVVGIVVLSLDDAAVSLAALAGALGTALAIFLLAHRGGFAGARLILIGIGVAAMLNSVVVYVLSRAPAWDLQTAMRWITGSLNSATGTALLPLAVACAILVPLLLAQSRGLSALGLGDAPAAGVGVHVARTRTIALLAATALLAFATAGAGPVSFVAFMAGPIALRLVGPAPTHLVPAGLVGALLVLGADLVGQFAFATRFPVGVVTGALGAPFLIVLLIRLNRSGRSL